MLVWNQLRHGLDAAKTDERNAISAPDNSRLLAPMQILTKLELFTDQTQ
jgi:hypothetical protein